MREKGEALPWRCNNISQIGAPACFGVCCNSWTVGFAGCEMRYRHSGLWHADNLSYLPQGSYQWSIAINAPPEPAECRYAISAIFESLFLIQLVFHTYLNVDMRYAMSLLGPNCNFFSILGHFPQSDGIFRGNLLHALTFDPGTLFWTSVYHQKSFS